MVELTFQRSGEVVQLNFHLSANLRMGSRVIGEILEGDVVCLVVSRERKRVQRYEKKTLSEEIQCLGRPKKAEDNGATPPCDRVI